MCACTNTTCKNLKLVRVRNSPHAQAKLLLPATQQCVQVRTVMKLLCHKMRNSKDFCGDAWALLTQGLNIKPLSHTVAHTNTHFNFNCSSTGWPPGYVYLSILTLSSSNKGHKVCQINVPSLTAQPGAVQINNTRGRHNTLQQIALHVQSSAEVTGYKSVCCSEKVQQEFSTFHYSCIHVYQMMAPGSLFSFQKSTRMFLNKSFKKKRSVEDLRGGVFICVPGGTGFLSGVCFSLVVATHGKHRTRVGVILCRRVSSV